MTVRLPNVAPGKASGTLGSTNFLHFGHQSRWIVCSVTTGVIPAGMSSMRRVRVCRQRFNRPWQCGQQGSRCARR